MQGFTPATSLARYEPSEVNESLGIVGEIKYWHPLSLKHLCRDINSQDYQLYCALGLHLLAHKLIPADNEELTPTDNCRILLAIIKFLPDDFIPYKSMGNTINAKNYDWASDIESLFE